MLWGRIFLGRFATGERDLEQEGAKAKDERWKVKCFGSGSTLQTRRRGWAHWMESLPRRGSGSFEPDGTGRLRVLDIPKIVCHFCPSMWEVFEHRRAGKQLDSLPVEVLKRYEKWKDIVRISGPSGLRLIQGFRDEALRGEWGGHRSSRLNLQYRVIYRVEHDRVLVEVVAVAPHDYRRKENEGISQSTKTS